MVTPKELGGRIRKARLAAGLSQATLAELADVTDETISRIERGAYEPAVSTLIAVAGALSIKLDALVGAKSGRATSSRRSPLAKKLVAVVEHLSSENQTLLLRVAEQMPEYKSSGRKRKKS